jgi:hypothetical protein
MRLDHNQQQRRRIMSVNVNEMTFGIEIETTVPYGTVQVGGHGHGRQVPWLPAGWLADRDPSIHADVAGHEACEFVSPVLKGKEGIKQMIAAIREIIAKGGKVNASCGLHIHVGFDKRNAVALRKLVAMVANFEKAIYAQTGTKARENGRWCSGLSRYGSLDRAMQHRTATRYYIVNTITDKPTVEFRPFAATLNVTKILGHVLTVIGMVEKTLASTRTAQFTAKVPKPTSPIARKGEGQTALCRLYYALGWTKGRESHTFGDLFVEDGPTIKEVKRELMRLAKKYDARA